MARTPSLSSCSSCGGFVPASTGVCPNCSKPSLVTRLRVGALGGALGGGALAFTLMACYGAPHCEDCVIENDDGGRSLADARVGADSATTDASSDAADADAARADGGDAGADADAAP